MIFPLNLFTLKKRYQLQENTLATLSERLKSAEKSRKYWMDRFEDVQWELLQSNEFILGQYSYIAQFIEKGSFGVLAVKKDRYSNPHQGWKVFFVQDGIFSTRVIYRSFHEDQRSVLQTVTKCQSIDDITALCKGDPWKGVSW